MPDDHLSKETFIPSPDAASLTRHQAGSEIHRAIDSGIPHREGGIPLRMLVENPSLGVIVVGTDGVVHSFNRAAEHIFGYRAEDVIGGPLTVIIPRRLRSAHEAGFQRYLESRVPSILGHAIRLPGLRRDGQETIVELVITMMENDAGLHFIGFVKDVGSESWPASNEGTCSRGRALCQGPT